MVNSPQDCFLNWKELVQVSWVSKQGNQAYQEVLASYVPEPDKDFRFGYGRNAAGQLVPIAVDRRTGEVNHLPFRP